MDLLSINLKNVKSVSVRTEIEVFTNSENDFIDYPVCRRITQVVGDHGDYWYIFYIIDFGFTIYDLVRGDSPEDAMREYVLFATRNRGLCCPKDEALIRGFEVKLLQIEFK